MFGLAVNKVRVLIVRIDELYCLKSTDLYYNDSKKVQIDEKNINQQDFYIESE
jgi:hypothetical protein